MREAPDTSHAELAGLRRAFPLASRWTGLDHFIEAVEIEGIRLHSAGLVATSEDGEDVTGSAAEIGQRPLARAYFELLERSALVDGRERSQIELIRADGVPLGFLHRDQLFPDSTQPHDFRYALSNGVAANTSLQRACASARAELVERDRILRSWFGGPAPLRLNSVQFGPTSVPQSAYTVKSYRFPSRDLQQTTLEVAGVFAFPKRPGVPFVFGSAAGPTLVDALGSAERECLQRLAFLWGETIPDEVPDFETTPSFHQDFYLCPRSHEPLRAWLNGEHDEGAPSATSLPPSETRFADLTPEHLRGRLWVVKAVPASELRLAFGRCYPGIDARLRRHGVHPIA